MSRCKHCGLHQDGLYKRVSYFCDSRKGGGFHEFIEDERPTPWGRFLLLCMGLAGLALMVWLSVS